MSRENLLYRGMRFGEEKIKSRNPMSESSWSLREISVTTEVTGRRANTLPSSLEISNRSSLDWLDSKVSFLLFRFISIPVAVELFCQDWRWSRLKRCLLDTRNYEKSGWRRWHDDVVEKFHDHFPFRFLVVRLFGLRWFPGNRKIAVSGFLV